MSFFYIIIGVSIIIPIIIIISNIIAFQGYHEKGELDDETIEMFVSSFDSNYQENTSNFQEYQPQRLVPTLHHHTLIR